MSDSEDVGVYRRNYIMNETQRNQARLRVHYLLTGETYTPYESWIEQYPANHFSSLVENGIRRLLENNDYYIPTSTRELAHRISYWAWETAVYHQTGRQRMIESNRYPGFHKSRSQYESYTFHISITDWNNVFDRWETAILFNADTLEGAEQRNGLPEYLWKFIRDDGFSGSEAESSDEDEPAPRKVKMSDLGWVTNNRRVF
jgi:hypothetical protein